jgi:hypothetical protein
MTDTLRDARQPEPARRDNAAPGYSGTGLSAYTLDSARHEPTPKMASRPDRVRGRQHTLPELIVETRARIRHVQAELRIEDDKDRRQKLEASLDIKLGFLAKLREEQEASRAP